jgi:hypothetical protein
VLTTTRPYEPKENPSIHRGSTGLAAGTGAVLAALAAAPTVLAALAPPVSAPVVALAPLCGSAPCGAEASALAEASTLAVVALEFVA